MIENPEQETDDANKALARKRRIELRSKKRHLDDEHGEKRVCIRDDEYYTVVPDVSSVLKKPSIRGIKKQARYDPGVPMTKEELVAWRKEARRVRNRESAAESRMRTRNRIDELESEMDVLKRKYSAALQRIVELEAAAAVHGAMSPLTLRQDAGKIVSPSSSPLHVPIPATTPEDSFTLSDKERDNQEVAQMHQHIIEMISRPNA